MNHIDPSGCYLFLLESDKEISKVVVIDFKNYFELLDYIRKRALSYTYTPDEKDGLDKTVMLIDNWSKHELEYDDVDKIMRGYIALTRAKEDNESIIGYGYLGEIFKHFLREDRFWDNEGARYRELWSSGRFDKNDAAQLQAAGEMIEDIKNGIANTE